MQQDVTLAQVLELATNLSLRDKVRLIEFVAPQIERALEGQLRAPLRPLYGLWQGFSISDEDIALARREMWGSFGERES